MSRTAGPAPLPRQKLTGFISRGIAAGRSTLPQFLPEHWWPQISNLPTGQQGQPASTRKKSLYALYNVTGRGRNVALLYLFYGTFFVTLLLFLALLHSYFVAGHHYVIGRLWVSVASFATMAITCSLVRREQFDRAAFMLVGFYAVLSVGTAWRWGINLPVGLLLGAITIILAGIMLDLTKMLYATGFLIGAMTVLQAGLESNVYHPNTSWAVRQSNFGDVIGYAAMYLMLALISWAFGREVIRSLERAEKAEADLLQEKLHLESRVLERTAKLRVMQLEKVQQLHRFAELGQLSTAMMHELANRLTSLSLDIETLHGQHRSDTLKRAQHTLRYIDTMTKNVSKRLHDLPAQRPFDTVQQTRQVVKSLTQKAAEAHVSIHMETPQSPCKGFGDAVQFSQIMTIVITNAIEAYDSLPATNPEDSATKSNVKPPISRTVHITFVTPNKQIVIRVIDHGRGIPAERRHLLFKPFNSNKQQGMGVGLYIAKTMLKTHFKGNIRLSSATNRTEFVITMPLYNRL